jgi:hypothetical protein
VATSAFEQACGQPALAEPRAGGEGLVEVERVPVPGDLGVSLHVVLGEGPGPGGGGADLRRV